MTINSSVHPNFSINDLNGWGGSINIGVPISPLLGFDFGTGANFSSTGIQFSTHTIGFSWGFKCGGSFNMEYTKVFPINY